MRDHLIAQQSGVTSPTKRTANHADDVAGGKTDDERPVDRVVCKNQGWAAVYHRATHAVGSGDWADGRSAAALAERDRPSTEDRAVVPG